MPTQRKQIYSVLYGDRERSLEEFVSQQLRVPSASARAHVEGGAVYLDGKRQRDPCYRLNVGQRVVIYGEPLAPKATETVGDKKITDYAYLRRKRCRPQ